MDANATFHALPFKHGILATGWMVDSIVTLQGGFPFTPQLSNPSNNGDTRNPVRPYVNPNFTGPVILGSPNNGLILQHSWRLQKRADFTEISAAIL